MKTPDGRTMQCVQCGKRLTTATNTWGPETLPWGVVFGQFAACGEECAAKFGATSALGYEKNDFVVGYVPPRRRTRKGATR